MIVFQVIYLVRYIARSPMSSVAIVRYLVSYLVSLVSDREICLASFPARPLACSLMCSCSESSSLTGHGSAIS